MTDFTQDLFARRRNASDGNTRVVTVGKMWYDSITNTLRVSDGHTPGGQIVTGQSGAYTLPTATSSVKGGVQLGANIIATGATIDVLSPTRVSQLENDSNYLTGSVLAGYATETFVTTRGYITANALTAGNANVVAANSTIQSISANLGAYQTYANSSISTLTANAGTQGVSINTINANLGAYQTWANNRTLSSLTNGSDTLSLNGANKVDLPGGTSYIFSASNNITLAPDNTGSNYLEIINNVGSVISTDRSFEIRTNADGTDRVWTFTQGGSLFFPDSTVQTTAYPSTLTANLGAYQTWANGRITTLDANIGTLSLGNISTQANLSAYQTWANGRITTIDANIGTLSSGNTSTQANLGAYQTWANGRITTLDANLGTATTNISNLVTQANANVAAYLTTYTGNVSAGNLNVGNYANIYIATGSTANKSALTIEGNIYGRGGVGYLDAIQLTNRYSLGTNTSKFLRVGPTGTFEIINNAYTQNIFSLADDGALSIPGQLFVNGAQTTNGPAFAAYAAAVLQTITSGSQQKVLFQTEEYDTNSNYANSRFTPTVAGYYQLNAEVRLDGASGTGEMMIILYKNGSEYKRGTNQSGTQIATNFWAMQVSSVVYANGTGDYFEIYVQQGSGGNVTVTAVNNPAITWFNGCMLRGA